MTYVDDVKLLKSESTVRMTTPWWATVLSVRVLLLASGVYQLFMRANGVWPHFVVSKLWSQDKSENILTFSGSLMILFSGSPWSRWSHVSSGPSQTTWIICDVPSSIFVHSSTFHPASEDMSEMSSGDPDCAVESIRTQDGGDEGQWTIQNDNYEGFSHSYY